MISRLEGVLESVDESAVQVRVGGITYEVFVPAFTASRLGDKIGQPITLHTFYFIEAPSQGATMLPRLAGFASVADRKFFQLFTSCKGIGNRRALRAMSLDSARLAAAVADRDVKLLQSLPEIGRRLAETIVATLSGKVDEFLSAAAFPSDGRGSASASAGAATQPSAGNAISREALDVLLQLGENRVQAVAWIDQAMRDPNDKPTTVDELITRVYRIKAGG